MATREVSIQRSGNVTVETVKSKRGGWALLLWIPTVLLLALAAGGLTGVLASYYVNNSKAAGEVAALATYRPSEVTKVYADDGETVIAEFALEKRIPIREKDIPESVENAILAIEDVRFYKHIGIDPYRTAGAAYKNIRTGSFEGASTLTQQITKNLFLTRAQTYERKINEWLMALQVERFYTKRQILEMYVNHIFLGAGAYGFEAAARTYFDKPLKAVTLEEAALLAAIPKAPGQYSPTNNPVRAKERRDLVLREMAENNFITQADADAAIAKPIKLADTAFYGAQTRSSVADYPIEEIRKYLEETYTTRVAQGGLQVYTTINLEAQELATKAIKSGLRGYDRGRGKWRSQYINISNKEDGSVTPKELQAYQHADWYGDEYEKGDFVKGLVMSVDQSKNEAAVRFGKYTATLTAKDMGRAAGRQPKTELKPGFLAEFEIKEVDADGAVKKAELSQIPEVQAAILTINAKTGEIPAMVGGYDFQTNRFNTATQALRQTGSCFKPYIYTAAVEWGMTPETPVSGAAIRKAGWSPQNYDGSHSHGTVPLKTALAKSYNIAAVHLLQDVGIQTGSQMVRRFGITEPMAPYLPSALGASEVSLIEMVSAYSTFPNKGVRVEPHLIRKVLDRDGNVLEEWEKTTFKVTSEYVALTMVDIMRGVTSAGGTAPNAQAAGHPLAGKTGTVNDSTDVWFIGYTPTYVTGVWMGNPERKESLGAGYTGGKGALPYFNAFMNGFMKDKPREKFEDPPKIPADIKALIEQREREEAQKREQEEEESMTATRTEGTTRKRATTSNLPEGDDDLNLDPITAPKLEQVTEPRSDTSTSPVTTSTTPKPASVQPPRVVTNDATRKPDATAAPKKPDAPPVGAAEPPKKKGKKGDDDDNR